MPEIYKCLVCNDESSNAEPSSGACIRKEQCGFATNRWKAEEVTLEKLQEIQNDEKSMVMIICAVVIGLVVLAFLFA